MLLVISRCSSVEVGAIICNSVTPLQSSRPGACGLASITSNAPPFDQGLLSVTATPLLRQTGHCGLLLVLPVLFLVLFLPFLGAIPPRRP
jgi:hypothetical protein